MRAPELSTIQIEAEGDVGILTLQRPDAFNALSPEMIGELTVAFAWCADQAPFRALIVTGAGLAFCAGGDLNWFRKGQEDEEHDLPADIRRGAEVMHTAFGDLRRTPYPVIGAINGPAAGAGMSLALACDIRIASEKAMFAPGYGRIGASPDGGMTYFLPRIVGPSRALELLLEDPDMGAERALEEKIVAEVVAPEALMDRARERAAELARLAPHYVRLSKSLINQTFENNFWSQLEAERHGIADGLGSEDARRGVAAFFKGEKPEFKGD